MKAAVANVTPIDWDRWFELLAIRDAPPLKDGIEMTATEWREFDEIRLAIDELAAECEMGWRKGCRGKP